MASRPWCQSYACWFRAAAGSRWCTGHRFAAGEISHTDAVRALRGERDIEVHEQKKRIGLRDLVDRATGRWALA